MENASKALLMAGGVLIAILIIALLVRSFTSISMFQKAQFSEEEQAQLVSFNEQYTKYLNQYVYGTEVLTLQNKYGNDKKVKVILTEGSEQPVQTENQYKYNEINNSYSNETRYYKCTSITYDEDRKSRLYYIYSDKAKYNSRRIERCLKGINMENASKALLMAAGILIGILILALIVTLFASAGSLSKEYEATKKSEAIQQFNVNFTKYLGQELTIHQVVTICNFARLNNVSITSGGKTNADIKDIVELYSNDEDSIPKYKLIIDSYSVEGYINSISFE